MDEASELNSVCSRLALAGELASKNGPPLGKLMKTWDGDSRVFTWRNLENGLPEDVRAEIVAVIALYQTPLVRTLAHNPVKVTMYARARCVNPRISSELMHVWSDDFGSNNIPEDTSLEPHIQAAGAAAAQLARAIKGES